MVQFNLETLPLYRSWDTAQWLAIYAKICPVLVWFLCWLYRKAYPKQFPDVFIQVSNKSWFCLPQCNSWLSQVGLNCNVLRLQITTIIKQNLMGWYVGKALWRYFAKQWLFCLTWFWEIDAYSPIQVSMLKQLWIQWRLNDNFIR